MPSTPVITIESVDWSDPRAVALRAAMDEEMSARYAPDLAGSSPEQLQRVQDALTVDPADITATFLAFADDEAVGHAALRLHGDDWELKRVVTLPAYRGLGISRALIAAVEAAVREAGGERIILQTGNRQPEAVRLYEWLGYRAIPVYPPYDVMPMSLCFARDLSS